MKVSEITLRRIPVLRPSTKKLQYLRHQVNIVPSQPRVILATKMVSDGFSLCYSEVDTATIGQLSRFYFMI